MENMVEMETIGVAGNMMETEVGSTGVMQM